MDPIPKIHIDTGRKLCEFGLMAVTHDNIINAVRCQHLFGELLHAVLLLQRLPPIGVNSRASRDSFGKRNAEVRMDQSIEEQRDPIAQNTPQQQICAIVRSLAIAMSDEEPFSMEYSGNIASM